MKKLNQLHLAFLSVAGWFLFSGLTEGQTVSNNSVELTDSSGDYVLGFTNPLIPGASNSAMFTASFDATTQPLEFTVGNIDYSVGYPFAFFLTPAATTFNPEFVNSNSPVISNTYLVDGNPDFGSSFSAPVSTPFYLGLWQGITSFDGGHTFTAEPGDSFGWVELEYTPLSVNTGTLELIDSEISSPSAGIIVGTTVVIPTPEPSSLAMFCSGIMLLAFVFMMRRTSARHQIPFTRSL